jgi:hypothetical protein
MGEERGRGKGHSSLDGNEKLGSGRARATRVADFYSLRKRVGGERLPPWSALLSPPPCAPLRHGPSRAPLPSLPLTRASESVTYNPNT